MTSQQVTQDREAHADARLELGVSVACLVAYGAFLALPYYVVDLWLPLGLDAVWALGAMLTLVLAPVSAGLAAYASFVALWLRGDVLPSTTRRLHLLTLLVAAVLAFGLVSTWGSDMLSWWLD